MRYEIKDDYLKQIFNLLWLLHSIDFHIVINRLIYCDKLLENDLKFFIFYLGQKKTSKILAYLYDYKKKYKKDLSNENINLEYLKDIEEQRKKIADEIRLLYNRLITKNENYFIISLIKDICLPIDRVT